MQSENLERYKPRDRAEIPVPYLHQTFCLTSARQRLSFSSSVLVSKPSSVEPTFVIDLLNYWAIRISCLEILFTNTSLGSGKDRTSTSLLSRG